MNACAMYRRVVPVIMVLLESSARTHTMKGMIAMDNNNNELTEVVYNNCYGGFGLSDEAVERIRELKGDSNFDVYGYYSGYKNRTDEDLIRVVKELGGKANSRHSNLDFHEIKKGDVYRIEEYDGWEKVVEAYDDWMVA